MEQIRIPERFKDHPLFNELICGTNFGFMAKRGYYFQEEVKKQPALMREMGINWTTLNMNVCQEHYFSRKVFLDFEFSSSESEIIDMTKRLHDNGIRVILKPCLTPLDGAAMGCVGFPDKAGLSQIQGVQFDYWKEWFHSYTEAQKYFSDLAERAGIDAMMIGAENAGTEGQNAYWENVIREVRNNFSNPITYEFTFASRKTHDLNWIKKVDFLSYSYYPPAADPNEFPLNHVVNPGAKDTPDYTVEDMMKYLESRKARIASIIQRFDNMPIAFTEFGVRSAHGCIMQPYNFLWDTPYDGEQQARFMEASFQTFTQVPGWMGLFWWKWDETQNRPQYHGDPNGDRGFTIQGKPAEAVMRRWFAKNKR